MNILSYPTQKKGFTLIELMAVVLIIGILVAIALPRYARAVHRSEMIESMTTVRTIFDSAVRHKAANSVAPTALDQLDVDLFDATSTTTAVFNSGNFQYNLTAEGVSAQKLPAGSTYTFMMYYPVKQGDGSYQADIICKPDAPEFTWLCKSFGGTALRGGYEIN